MNAIHHGFSVDIKTRLFFFSNIQNVFNSSESITIALYFLVLLKDQPSLSRNLKYNGHVSVLEAMKL